MLKANKSKIFEQIFSVYNKNLLKRRFHSIMVKGLENLKTRQTSLPLIIYANHSSWWDGLVAFQISHESKLDSFIMMEEKHLRRFFLFRKLGAFSVIRENPRSALQSINYAVNLLNETNRVLWIFPQGEILPNNLRPLNFFSGISKIVKKLGECTTICLTIKYEFLNEFKPQIFVSIKSPEIHTMSRNTTNLTNRFEHKTTENLNEIQNDIFAKRFDEYSQIV